MLPVRPILVPEADTSNRNCKVLLDGGFYERVIHFDYEQFCPLLLYIQTILFVLIVLCMFTLEPWLGSFKNADLRKVFVEIQLWEFCVYVRMKITGLCQSSIFWCMPHIPTISLSIRCFVSWRAWVPQPFGSTFYGHEVLQLPPCCNWPWSRLGRGRRGWQWWRVLWHERTFASLELLHVVFHCGHCCYAGVRSLSLAKTTKLWWT